MNTVNTIHVEPNQLFRMTSNPTELHALSIEGTPWLIHRDANNHPHFAPMKRRSGRWITTNIDNVEFEAKVVTVADRGDVVYFDNASDAWTVQLDDMGRPFLVAR